jgi:hypothetical protein
MESGWLSDPDGQAWLAIAMVFQYYFLEFS